ncbi:hypothetical protein CVT25_010027 [Psilocybe cyanescens]|uniref:Uncharacterized protein n=1 Tax=Psilocybe cyanescens TaxID=93625 RepID=A0A409X3B5_PSICY|nr:hypothetical protein CVT25_010027 [Psilocybe cyanescens]
MARFRDARTGSTAWWSYSAPAACTKKVVSYGREDDSTEISDERKETAVHLSSSLVLPLSLYPPGRVQITWVVRIRNQRSQSVGNLYFMGFGGVTGEHFIPPTIDYSLIACGVLSLVAI